ncbi:MAG: hypothetical protein HY343_10235, partial [Lentisphaerae bacterium]|nr:hypothetical protein [Lentisphaerota bacterium]
MRLRSITMVCLLLGLFAPVTQAATRTWQVGVGDWSTGANWNGGLPVAGDDVVVTNAGASVFLTMATPYLASFTLGSANAGARTLTFSNWNTALLSAANVTILTNGVVTCIGSLSNGFMSNRVYITCDNFTLDAGGIVNVDAKGWSGGPGASTVGHGPGGGRYTAGSGAGYGGAGGNIYWLNGNPYGNPAAPSDAGSGGSGSSNPSRGGNGGGAVRINASGLLTLNGVITANGQLGTLHSGGGSGGGVWITCGTVAGIGAIRANGNDTSGSGSSGGGGRIALAYDPAAQAALPVPPISMSVTGGGYGTTAHLGTLYFPDGYFLTETMSRLNGEIVGVSSWAPTNLVVSNCTVRFVAAGFQLSVLNDLRIVDRGSLQLGGDALITNAVVANNLGCVRYTSMTGGPALWVGGSLVVSNGGNLYLYGGLTNSTTTNYGAVAVVQGAAVVYSNSWIYMVSHPTNGGSVLFKPNSLTIRPYGGINATSRGFAGGAGVSASGGGKGGLRSGGGYGGAGGYTNPAAMGPAYGLANGPADPGSGGGTGNVGTAYNNITIDNYGGNGGGLIRIFARAGITNDGALNADGHGGGVQNNGGGSGGGIYLIGRSLGGTGTLSAAGGSTANPGGSGGGGRIALWSINDTFAGAISVTNGVSTVANGALGTVVRGRLPDIGVSTTNLACSIPIDASSNLTFETWNLLPTNALLTYSVSTNVPWLSVLPVSGASTGEHDTITVTCSSAGMDAGIFTGEVSVAFQDGYEAYQVVFQTVRVVMSVLPIPGVSPTNFFRSITVGTNASMQSFQVWNSAGMNALYYEIVSDAAWLSVTPTNGTSSGEYDPIVINYATASLAVGVYTGHLSVAAVDVASGLQAFNSPLVLTVVMEVRAIPGLRVSPLSLSNEVTEAHTAAGQGFQVWNGSAEPRLAMNYTIGDNASWFSESPADGTSQGGTNTVQVLYDTATLAPGYYSGAVTVTAAGGASNS